MRPEERPPAGPRGRTGAAAEAAAVSHLVAQGWAVLGRNLRVDGVELDILAQTPQPGSRLVIVEVRARSGPGFGSALESVDWRKVARLYRAALGLAGAGRVPRVDLMALRRTSTGAWKVEEHLRGVEPPGPGR